MKKIIAIIASIVPSVAFAQMTPITDLNGVTSKAIGIGDAFTYLLVALAVIYIVWNVVYYLIRPEGDKKAAGMNILYGVVGLFVIVSIWGLVNIFTNSFATVSPGAKKIPNLGNNPNGGGIPANQIPVVY